MKLEFVGTRGYIDERSDLHRRHSALMVSYRRRRVLIDCGADWLGHLPELSPHAIVLTHAHPDHAFGLKKGAGCPVFATRESFEVIDGYPIEQRHLVHARRPLSVEGIEFEAFPVAHSLRAPAVGYRIGAGRAVVFYVPDVVYIEEREEALAGVRLFIGDGATLTRQLVRRRGDALIGHTPVRTQVTWCWDAGIPRAVFTHCGSEIVTGDAEQVEAKVRAFGQERGVEATIARDGMALVLRWGPAEPCPGPPVAKRTSVTLRASGG